MTLDAGLGDDAEQDPSDPASREARLERLRELVHKPMLNHVEQMFILQAMSEGIEI